MLLKIQKYFETVKPVTVDGTIAVLVAMLIALQTYLSNDDIYKYMAPMLIFYLKMIIGTIAAGLTALQYFRSKAYAEHREQKDKQNEKNSTIAPVS